MISFANAVGQECRINVYYTTMTLGVVYPNPENPFGHRKQEYYRNATTEDIDRLFAGIAPGGRYKARSALRVPVPRRED